MTIDATYAPASIQARKPRARAEASKWELGIGHALLILLAVFCVFPVYWMIVTSLRPANEVFSTNLLPDRAALDNYRYALDAIPMVRMLINTFVVSAAVTVIQLLTGLLAAYGFARWRFPGKNVLFGAIALTWLVPLQVVMIPNYLMMAHMGLIDTLAALICHGALSRFPDLRVLVVENGSGWVKNLLRQLDKAYRVMPKEFDEHPVEVFKRNVYIHPFLEDDVASIVEIMGEDHVMFGSDFPHPEGIGDPLSFVDRLDGISDEAKAKIMGGNAIEQLRLKVKV